MTTYCTMRARPACRVMFLLPVLLALGCVATRADGPDSTPAAFPGGTIEYTLFARLEEPQMRAVVLSDLHANIQDIFNVHGVQIMSPHYEADPEHKVWVPKENWYPAPADECPGSARVDTSKGIT